MKIGQILATVPGTLPPNIAEAFLKLTNDAPPMGPFFVKRRLKGEWGSAWEKASKSFLTPAFAASLGQVRSHFEKWRNSCRENSVSRHEGCGPTGP